MEAIPHPEHPRPDLQRPLWHSLNGYWQFASDSEGRGLREEWWHRSSLPQEVLVPFPIGSERSGAQAIDAPQAVYWYLRPFDLPPSMHHRCLHLHFGAADCHARAWLNGILLGDHDGGYTPFSFEVTDLVRPQGNRLVLRIADSRSPRQVRGKQTWRREPFSVFYPGISGLWQSVWLEATGPSRLLNPRLGGDPARGCVHVRAAVQRPEAAAWLDVSLRDGSPHAHFLTRLRVAGGRVAGAIPLPSPRPWTPEAPQIYELELVLRTEEGAELDRLHTYAALREIAVRDGRVLLNGQPLYQRLALMQGYYPGGVYTPLADADWRRDVELVKAMGFNGLRMHQKLEAPRFLYWCDRLGLLVWSELPSAYWPGSASRAQIRAMLPEMIGRDANHPSIIAWVLFNESWGIHDLHWCKGARLDVVQLANLARNLDPSRLVIDNSGFDHLDTDLMDIHHYLADADQIERVYDALEQGRLWRCAFLPGLRYLLQPERVFKPPLGPGARYQGQPVLVSECGGHGHFGAADERPLLERYRDTVERIARRGLFQGFCYTQAYDTYQEEDGLLTFDRQPKVPIEALRAINEGVNRLETQ
ncbi:MAG: glycoside hydrolase family 2 protein [Anaerolineae bacterium]